MIFPWPKQIYATFLLQVTFHPIRFEKKTGEPVLVPPTFLI
jgi:hypothetical protein